MLQQKKLEDAVDMAGNFHGELNKFIAWLTETEKTLNNLQPVSRLVDKVATQIEDHKVRGVRHRHIFVISLLDSYFCCLATYAGALSCEHGEIMLPLIYCSCLCQ